MLSFVLRMVRILANKLSGSGSGVDKSKGLTATAGDIVAGKTAAVNKEIITGNVKEYKSAETLSVEGTVVKNSNGILFSSNDEINAVLRANSKIECYTAASNLGDAKVSDVAIGKTFTSANGVTLNGSFDTNIYAGPSSNNSCTGSYSPGYTFTFTFPEKIGTLLAFYAVAGSNSNLTSIVWNKDIGCMYACDYDTVTQAAPTISGNTIKMTFKQASVCDSTIMSCYAAFQKA